MPNQQPQKAERYSAHHPPRSSPDRSVEGLLPMVRVRSPTSLILDHLPELRQRARKFIIARVAAPVLTNQDS
jgi:hypothetical protein